MLIQNLARPGPVEKRPVPRRLVPFRRQRQVIQRRDPDSGETQWRRRVADVQERILERAVRIVGRNARQER